jgi:hypothetical protein
LLPLTAQLPFATKLLLPIESVTTIFDRSTFDDCGTELANQFSAGLAKELLAPAVALTGRSIKPTRRQAAFGFDVTVLQAINSFETIQ